MNVVPLNRRTDKALREFNAQFEISYVFVTLPSGGAFVPLVVSSEKRWLLRLIPDGILSGAVHIKPNAGPDAFQGLLVEDNGLVFKYDDEPDFCQTGWQGNNDDFVDIEILVVQTIIRG